MWRDSLKWDRWEQGVMHERNYRFSIKRSRRGRKFLLIDRVNLRRTVHNTMNEAKRTAKDMLTYV